MWRREKTQRGSSGNCYGDDVSGNWKVVSFVVFVCGMEAILVHRNRCTYTRWPTNSGIYVQLQRIHNHPRQLRRVHNILKVVYLHGIRPANFGPADVVLPSATLAASTCLEGTEILAWVNCGPFACRRLYSLGSILYRASAESPS